jgi:hypothetical protein
MSLVKPLPQTDARRAANHANSRKSTGPKTRLGKKISSANALKPVPSAGVRPLWQAMPTLGEDPGRYQAMLRDTVASCSPRTPLELRLCQDVTHLLLMAERNRQAQEAKLVRTFEKLENSRQRQQREMEGCSSYDALQSEVLEKGLRRAPDSPAKFSEATACLERLQTRVASGDFSDETELDALYGKDPTFRGAGIINGFRALAENPGDRDLRSSLRQMILEETRNVAEEYQLYFREHVAISRAMRLECLAPAADPEYVRLQRQESAIDQRLERKIKLLLALRAANRRDAAEEADAAAVPVDGAIETPVGWIDAPAESSQRSPLPSRRALSGAPEELQSPEGPSARKTRGKPANAQARDLSLRHKMGLPRRRESKDQWDDVAKSIRSIYGLDAEPKPATVAATNVQVETPVQARGSEIGSPQEASAVDDTESGGGDAAASEQE